MELAEQDKKRKENEIETTWIKFIEWNEYSIWRISSLSKRLLLKVKEWKKEKNT